MPALYMIDLAHKYDRCACVVVVFIYLVVRLYSPVNQIMDSRMKSSIITLMLFIYVMPRMKITYSINNSRSNNCFGHVIICRPICAGLHTFGQLSGRPTCGQSIYHYVSFVSTGHAFNQVLAQPISPFPFLP